MSFQTKSRALNAESKLSKQEEENEVMSSKYYEHVATCNVDLP